MKKYTVAIARTETTIYYFDVEAEHEGIAEEIASDRYGDNDYDRKNTVWGEDDLYEIKEVENENS